MTESTVQLKEAKSLPQGWRWMRLGDVCEEVYRYPTYYNIEYVEQGVPEVRGELIKEDGTLETDLTKYRFIAKETSEGYSRTVLREGDFVLSVRGSMGRVAVVPNELDGANMTANLIRISPSRTSIYSPFLKLVFLSTYFQSALEQLSPQTTIRTIKAPMLKSISIALPPLPEQKRIATKVEELMKDVEHARLACEARLEAAKALPQAYLRQVFESEEARKWERRRLGELCGGDSGVWGDPGDDSPSCFPILRSNNIQNGTMVFDDVAVRKVIESSIVDKKRLLTGDIIVTTSSGSKNLLGKSALFVQPPDGSEYLFSNFTMRLRSHEGIVEPTFLYFYLQSPRAKQTLTLLQDTTTGLRNLDRTGFLAQIVPIPSLTQQKRIATELRAKMEETEKLRASIEKQLEAIKALPQAILRKAFRGELWPISQMRIA